MKVHEKKKAYRKWRKEQAKSGKMNNKDGIFTNRAGYPDSSMKRDYVPNR